MTDLNTHKISFAGYTVFLAFRKGYLFMILLPEKGMNHSLQQLLMGKLPSEEKDLKNLNCVFDRHGKYDITKKVLEEAKTQQDKIVLFGMAYKHYRGVSYNHSDQEKANIKHVPVNKKLLATFFETPELTVFTVENYIKRINITKDYAVNGFPDQRTAKFPDGWDYDFWRDKNLDDKTRLAYEQHLVSKGYERRRTGAGVTYFAEREVHNG